MRTKTCWPAKSISGVRGPTKRHFKLNFELRLILLESTLKCTFRWALSSECHCKKRYLNFGSWTSAAPHFNNSATPGLWMSINPFKKGSFSTWKCYKNDSNATRNLIQNVACYSDRRIFSPWSCNRSQQCTKNDNFFAVIAERCCSFLRSGLVGQNHRVDVSWGW